MANQFGRPSADTSIGTYVDEAAGTTNIYTHIDEVTASDADFIESVVAPSSAPYVTKLTTLIDPAASTGHILRVRAAKDAAGGSQIDLTAELREGYVNEGTPGTLIATLTQTNVTSSFTDYSHTLSGAEADAITDYDDLFVRIVADQV